MKPISLRVIGPRAIIVILAIVASFVTGMLAFRAVPAFADDSLVFAQDEAEQALTTPSVVLSGGNVATSTYLKGKGWTTPVTSGKTAGKKGKTLRALKISLTGIEGVSGSVSYRVYARGKGWRATASDGVPTGKVKDVEAVKIWLSGDVASHYDVIYRVYMKGKGWQPWVKNKAKSGITKKGLRVNAVQVKLSPKTEDAIGRSADTVGVRYEGRLGKKGWQSWTGDGGTAGKANKKKQLEGLAIKVDTGSYSGGVTYRAYIQGKKWKQGWKNNGATVGKSGKRLEGIQIKLTGEIANAYDIYYRMYVQKYGWLDWAVNGQSAGGPGNKLRVGAIQIVMVPKDGTAPGATTAPTVKQRNSQGLDGIDISSWQPDLVPAKVDADFIIVKATGGKSYTNPYFKLHANATLKAGKLLGLYHFACDRGHVGTAQQEADHFVSAVGPYIGKAVLVLDWEADALLKGTSWAKTFLDRVYSKTGVRPLIYMSKSYTRSYNWSSVASNYKLWVAQYPNRNRTGYKTSPWTDSYGYGAWSAPTMFQYTANGRISGYGSDLDLNKFYGTAATWRKLAAKS